ncbi:hypothetical protein GCWU000246_01123 [Jonquetella anthropi E3_33 E1]|nr:hypothetical protein GCWU000246_01123 [Jonquetella anthropi E3_33 E1]
MKSICSLSAGGFAGAFSFPSSLRRRTVIWRSCSQNKRPRKAG